MKITLAIIGAIYLAVLLLAAVGCMVLGGVMASIDPSQHEQQADNLVGVFAEAVGVGLGSVLIIVLGYIMLGIGALFMIMALLFMTAYLRDMRGKSTRGFAVFLSFVGIALSLAVIVAAIIEKQPAIAVLLVPTLPMSIYGVLSIVNGKRLRNAAVNGITNSKNLNE